MSLSAEEAEEPIEEAAPQPSDYVADVRFEDLPLSEEVLAGIRERGYERPTPVQARCIEPALKGRDLSVRSKTGTGKTAAFGIPLIETVEPRGQLPQAVVLAPTRELANQVAEELAALGKHKSVRVLSIIGGASMQAQLDALARGVDIVVGTPGRVLDHIRRGTLDLSQVKVRVLDEADEMLSMGFLEEVTSVLNACPEEAQTLLFSATLPEDLGRIVARYMKDPESILLSGDEFTVEGIENRLYETRDDYPKPRNLLYLLEMEDPDSAIIFCNTRDDTALVTAVLNRHGLPAALLNSDLSQKEREKAMQRIKSGEIRFLVATDLAARGIDISDLSHVVNYSLPEDPAVYMHRVGRTGRIGKKGTALSLVTGRDLHTLKALETKYGVHFEKCELPDPEEARRHWAERLMKELRQGMEGSVFEAYLPLVKELKARSDGDFLLAFALKYYFDHARRARAVSGAKEARRSREKGKKKEKREARQNGKAQTAGREGGPRRDEAPAAGDGQEKTARPPRLYVNLGSEHGLDAEGVKAALLEAAGLPEAPVGGVDLHESHSYVTVEDSAAADALLAAHGKTHGDRTLRVERARSSGRKRRRRRRK